MSHLFTKNTNMSLPNYKIPLFDIDGTLLKSNTPTNLHDEAFDYALKTVYKLPHASVKSHSLSGKIDSQILIEISQIYGASETEAKEKVQDAMTATLDYFIKHVERKHFKAIPETESLLKELKSLGIPLGILTGNIEEIGWEKMQLIGFKDYFTFGAFGSLALKRVDLIPIAKERLEKMLGVEIPLENFVIIGDTPLDIACARAGNIPVIAVSTGKYQRHELNSADLVVETLGDREKIINFLKIN